MSRIDMEELFDRYVKGEASPNEVERVEAWLQHYHNPGAEWQEMDQAAKEKWLESFYQDIETVIGEEGKVVPMRPRRLWLRVVAAVAAMLVLALGLYVEWPRDVQM